MRSDTDRRRMIRHHQHSEIHPGGVQPFLHEADHSLIQVFNGLHLALYAALMPHLVGSFHMDIGEIIAVFRQSVHGRLGLPFIVGIQRAVRALDNDILHACADRDAL